MASYLFNKSQLRKTDEILSNVISDFLDTNFYKNTTNFNRIFDKERQIIGVDTIFTLNDVEYVCDEKAAVQYINKYLKTFALELSFFNRGNIEMDGWLLNDTNVNNSYLFCWIDKAKTNKPTSITDILDIEIALVKKENIYDYLTKIGWNKDNLLAKTQKIRINESEYLGDLYDDGCRFCKSFQLVERPINILLKRDTLIDLSDYTKHFIF